MNPSAKHSAMSTQEPDFPGPKAGLLSGSKTTVKSIPTMSKPPPSVFAQTGFHFLLLLVASALFAVTAWFAQGSRQLKSSLLSLLTECSYLFPAVIGRRGKHA